MIVIVGPTAVGKTELAIQLAERLNGEIVSADSRLFYRGMDIGTAKPSAAEMARVRHHLIDVAAPDEIWSLAVFQEAASAAIADIHQRGKLPLLVGGTGQYIRAVTQSWTPPEVTPNPQLRSALERMAEEYNAQWLHDKLKILDPVAAEKIDARNVRRTVRALEVIFSTGERFSAQGGTSVSPYQLTSIGLMRPRLALYERVDARIESMFANGLLDEVRALLQKGYAPSLSTMSAIGYRECVAVLQGNMTLEEAKVQIRKMTRIFVRRQSNWFKEDDPQIRWFEMDGNTIADVESYLTKKLGSEK